MPSENTLQDAPHGSAASPCSAVRRLQSALQDNRLELFVRALRIPGTRGDTTPRGCELDIGVRDADGTLLRGAALDTLFECDQLRLAVDRRAMQMAVAELGNPGSPLATVDPILLPLTRPALSDQTMAAWLDQFLREHAQIAPRFGFVLDAAALTDDLAATRHDFERLGRHGCRIMLNGLGISGAGLDLLRSQHVAFLGMGGELVHQVVHDSAAFETVLGLCRVAAACNIATVACAVEDRALAATLGKMGVNHVLEAATQALHG